MRKHDAISSAFQKIQYFEKEKKNLLTAPPLFVLNCNNLPL